MPNTTDVGWVVSESIALELETFLYFLRDPVAQKLLDPEVLQLLNSVPQDWLDQWDTLGLSRLVRLDHAAFLAGVLLEKDYSRATLAIRELAFDQVLVTLQAQAQELGIELELHGSVQDQVFEIYYHILMQLRQGIEFMSTERKNAEQRYRREMAALKSIFPGGEHFMRFWFLLDRFFYEIYRPWRESRQSVMDAQYEQAIEVLGVPSALGTMPPLDWLSSANPMRTPDLQHLIVTRRLMTQFWIEPFGMFDLLFVMPHMVITSIDPGDVLLLRYKAFIESISARLQALADPNRLAMLRITRHLEMNNTDLANMLGIARPTVSVHAKILRDAGLISTRTEGRQVRHVLQASEIKRLYEDLKQFLDIDSEND